MKELTDYITEKAKFLVKKHVNKDNNIVVAKSFDELEDGCYAKITSLFTNLIKYSNNNTEGKVGYYWLVWKEGTKIVHAEICNATNTSYLTNKNRINSFAELTDEDYAIINYMETHEFKPEEKVIITGKY